MAYDALVESVELIRTGAATPVRRLSRRRRFAPMSVDVGRDFAVTAFARRGVGCVLYETHVLALRKGLWVLLGGGGGGGDDALLADRPGWVPGFGRWISHATVLVSSEVHTVTVAGRRIAVPWHGRPVVAWTDRRPPRWTTLIGPLPRSISRPRPGSSGRAAR
ncbi:MAG: hypothetical protein WKF57_12870 [Nakamurella sp.]